MKLFLDTSILIKLYYKEEGTSVLDDMFINYTISEIYLSEIAKVEFSSAIYKKVRTGTLTPQNCADILNSFIADEYKYSFIKVNQEIIDLSRKLIEKYGIAGLRTLDAIQLATVINIRPSINMALTADKLLNEFLVSENIKISI